ncbi:sugar ABC transporter ATP-binding protein [Nonomuraea sp. NPDC048916]|uniref:sugar ABC transporter ATP-binding protein n=1 Tax=Nonomuraea sp. NPDC048916 TaxID=3154232 RepID=UPI0033F16E8B
MSFVIDGVRKCYGANEVLKGVSLRCEPGQVQALLGANGAGKSTLIKCLSGAHAPDAGTIQLDGEVWTGLTPQRAAEAGIAVIYQHLSLVASLSISDNVFLGRELRHGPLLARAEQRRRTREALSGVLGPDHGLREDTIVGDLPIASQQLVEIVKATSRPGIRVLILDEPTAALSDREAGKLKDVVRRIAASGVHVLFITHILGDVFDLCDRITVLRDGVVALDEPVGSVRTEQLTEAITGRLPAPRRVAGPALSRRRTPMLTVSGLSGERFDDVTFTSHEGEVVAIFGLVGSGRSELLETLYGARRADVGTVQVGGRTVPRRSSPKAALRAGIALVPGDRARQAVFADLDAADNVLQPAFGQLGPPLLRHRAAERRRFAAGADQVRLHPSDPALAARAFSGGNQQKLVLSRWLAAYQGVRVLLLDEPTQGIDVGARADIYQTLRSEEVLTGRTVVFTTSDPDEVALLADRVLVLVRGRIVAELPAEPLDRNRMLHLSHLGILDPVPKAPQTEGVSRP